MSVDLIYKHQQKTYELMRQALEEKKRAAYVFPVGCGKSFPVLKYLEENPEKTVLFVYPNTGIKNQFLNYVSKYILEGQKVDKEIMPRLRCVSYSKLAFLEEMTGITPDVIVFDEFHRTGTKGAWEEGVDRLLENNPEAQVIGMTATPERTDGRNMLDEKFGNDIVYEMSLTEALSGEKEEEQVLKGARYVRVISEFGERLEEYREKITLVDDEEKRKQLEEKYEKLESIVSNAPGIEDVMEQGMKNKNGKYIVFCKDGQDMSEKMEQAHEIFSKVNPNIRMDYVLSKGEGREGKTPAQNRKTIEEFEKREEGEELQLLFCVDMLNEGVHIQGISGEVMFRPTDSSIVYKQQIGRVMSSNKEAEETVIIDAVNNWYRQIDAYNEIERAIQRGQKDKTEYDLLGLSPEELELLDVLRQIDENSGIYIHNAYEEIIEWLEEHDGEMVRSQIKKGRKVLSRNEMTEEEKNETRLYSRWQRSKERQVLDEYAGKTIEEVPEEYRQKIETLRSYGLGQKEKTAYEEIIEWLEEHDEEMPRSTISKDGKILKTEEMTEEEKNEKNLYFRWIISQEREVLDEYAGRSIEEVPEEYREKIEILRSYGLGKKEKTTYEEIIEWLEEHDGEMVRSQIRKGRKVLSRNEMTEEEKNEIRLYHRWWVTTEREILDEYTGKPIDEVPEEYRQKIETLRSYGLGQKEKTAYEEIIEWLEEHDGEMPRNNIRKNRKQLSRDEMTEEEKNEVNLYGKWRYSKEREMLDEYAGRPIEEVPEEYRQKIETLRSYRLGQKEKTAYEEIIEWLEEHKGKMLRSKIKKDGKLLSRNEMTEEEKNETRLYHRWFKSQEREVLDEYAGIPIEEVPEEYREKIKILRSYGIMGKKKDQKIKDKMRKTVGKHVGDNEKVRKELEEIEKGEIQEEYDD